MSLLTIETYTVFREQERRLRRAQLICSSTKDQSVAWVSYRPVDDDWPDLEAIADEAPQELFNDYDPKMELVSTFRAGMLRCFSLEDFLDDYENPTSVRHRVDMPIRLRDVRELLWEADQEVNAIRDPSSRTILPGLLLIDCFSGRVVEAEPNCEYVALSYVWGSAGTCGEDDSLNQDPLERRFTQTVQDAMNVVRVLGMQYLWVDRYCINSTEPGTKHYMISNMDSIYETAYLTIIAASGRSGEHGLPSVSGLWKALGVDYVPPWDGLVYTRLSYPCLDSYVRLAQIDISPWSTRGWTYQEGLLSRRRLIFTDDWASLHYRGQDCVRASSGIFAHINEYSRRNLTYPSDLLNAFLGVFRAYERLQPPAMHVWGVPFLLDANRNLRQALIGCGLLWRANIGGSLSRIQGLPSWTWAGWNGWSLDDTVGCDSGSRHLESGPYQWLIDQARQQIRNFWGLAWAPSDIYLQVMAGEKLTDIGDYFRAGSSGSSVDAAPYLYLTSWSTTVTAMLSPTMPISIRRPYSRIANIAFDGSIESLCEGKTQVDGYWSCEWTAAIIYWGGGEFRKTQSLLLEPVGEGMFRRVGVLETDWQKPPLNGTSESLSPFTRTRLCIV